MVYTESSQQVASLYQLRPHLKLKGHGLPWRAEGGNPLRHRLQLVEAKAAKSEGPSPQATSGQPQSTLEDVVKHHNAAVYRKVRGRGTAVLQDAGWQEGDQALTIRTRNLLHPLKISGFYSPLGRKQWVLAEFSPASNEPGFKPPESISLSKHTPVHYLAARK